jgi:hypothetical protein
VEKGELSFCESKEMMEKGEGIGTRMASAMRCRQVMYGLAGSDNW